MDSNYLKKFKNNALDKDEMRRRRAKVTVELRKSKKEESLLKRRNCIDITEDQLSDEENLETQSNTLFKQYDSLTSDTKKNYFESVIESASSPDPNVRLIAVKTVRKLLSSFKNPPTDQLIEAGIIPVLVKNLADNQNSAIQFEVAWALTNIASGESDQTNEVVKCGAAPILIELLSSPNMHVVEQAVWAIGNIVGDGPNLRDYCINFGLIPSLLKLVSPTQSLQLLRNVTWVLVNLCRRKDPAISVENIIQLLPSLKYLISLDDVNILTDTVWAINYLTDIGSDITQYVIDLGFIPYLIPLLNHTEFKVQTSSLRTLGNIVTGSDEQTQVVLNCGILNHLAPLLEKKCYKTNKEACWLISNVTAGNPNQIQMVIDTGLIDLVINLLEFCEFSTQREAAWAITNITISGNPSQIQYLINHNVIPPMCNLLTVDDDQTLNVLLDGFYNILNAFPTNEVMYQIEECGGLDKIESLQSHNSDNVYMIAFKIIETFFLEDEDDENLAPKVNEKGELYFGVENKTDNSFNF